jgi:3-oxoacyl-[acyl-carrier-protein] synthase-3
MANGDGVCAMVVGQSETSGFLGAYTVNTAETCDALSYDLDLDRDGRPCIRMRLNQAAGPLIREATERCFTECVEGVLARAELTLDDIDFFSFNASAAWLVPFYASLLGIDARKTIDTYRWFANTGPVLVPTGLFYGAHTGRLRDGARVLVFGIGNTSNATAMILNWTDVGLADPGPEFGEISKALRIEPA